MHSTRLSGLRMKKKNRLKPMFENKIKPYLKDKTGKFILERTIKLSGIGESFVENDLKDLIEKTSKC